MDYLVFGTLVLFYTVFFIAIVKLLKEQERKPTADKHQSIRNISSHHISSSFLSKAIKRY